MSINKKLLESVEESDLQNLLENQVAESKILDYKETLPGNSDKDKKSSFSMYRHSPMQLVATSSME